jgi:hypothetical protein
MRWLPGTCNVAPLSKRTSVRHQMMFIVAGRDHGPGITSDWSEWIIIEPLPGRAMLAVKLETMWSAPSNPLTIASATG